MVQLSVQLGASWLHTTGTEFNVPFIDDYTSFQSAMLDWISDMGDALDTGCLGADISTNLCLQLDGDGEDFKNDCNAPQPANHMMGSVGLSAEVCLDPWPSRCTGLQCLAAMYKPDPLMLCGWDHGNITSWWITGQLGSDTTWCPTLDDDGNCKKPYCAGDYCEWADVEDDCGSENKMCWKDSLTVPELLLCYRRDATLYVPPPPPDPPLIKVSVGFEAYFATVPIGRLATTVIGAVLGPVLGDSNSLDSALLSALDVIVINELALKMTLEGTTAGDAHFGISTSGVFASALPAGAACDPSQSCSCTSDATAVDYVMCLAVAGFDGFELRVYVNYDFCTGDEGFCEDIGNTPICDPEEDVNGCGNTDPEENLNVEPDDSSEDEGAVVMFHDFEIGIGTSPICLQGSHLAGNCTLYLDDTGGGGVSVYAGIRYEDGSIDYALGKF